MTEDELKKKIEGMSPYEAYDYIQGIEPSKEAFNIFIIKIFKELYEEKLKKGDSYNG